MPEMKSELDEPIWAVVSVSKILGSARDYENAAFVAKKYQEFGEQGVTITTAEAANRMRNNLYERNPS